MDIDEYNEFCGSLSHAEHVVQWGGAHVWKIGGKVFAIAGWQKGETLAVTFKVSKIAYEVLKAEPGLRPAPYLASRGLTWIQRVSDETMEDEDLREHIRESYHLAGEALSKRVRSALGLV